MNHAIWESHFLNSKFPDNKAFESDYFYKRTYTDSYSSETTINTWNEGVSLVETYFVAEPDKYTIDNSFKEGYSTFIHPNANTAAGTYSKKVIILQLYVYLF